jgi:molybdenum cofactor cytidylyltransferase
MIASVLDTWRTSRVDAVILVVHPDDTQLAEIGRDCGAEVVVPSAPPPDMKKSVQLGLEFIEQRWAPTHTDAWLVAPADMSLLTLEAIDDVVSAFSQSAPSIVVPCFQGRRGHPVAFPWALSTEVARLSADEGLNVLTSRHEVRQVDVSTPHILTDVDTPEDYRKLGERDAS